MKLIDGLAVLKKDEWSSFRKFILMNSSENSDVFILFSSLQRSKTKLGDNGVLDKIKSKRFLGLTQKNYLNLQSKLYQILEDWFVFYDTKKDHFQHELILIKGLNNRGLYKLAESIYDKHLKALEEDESKDFHTEQKRYLLHHAMYYSDSTKKQDDLDLLKKIVQNFLKYSKNQLLFYNMELHSWGNIKSLDHSDEIKSVEKILDILRDNTEDILEKLSKVVIDLDKEAFDYCLDYLFCSDVKAKGEFERIFILYLFNKAGLLWQKGKIANKEKLLQLCFYGYESGASISNGSIPLARFYNTIGFVMYFGNHETGIAFVDKWIDKVDTKAPDTVASISKAMIDFYQGNYQDVIDQLMTIQQQETRHKLRIYSLLLIAYYELKNEYGQTLVLLIDNYKRLLQRQKDRIPFSFYMANKNLVFIIESLYIKGKALEDLPSNKLKYIMYRAWVNKQKKR